MTYEERIVAIRQAESEFDEKVKAAKFVGVITSISDKIIEVTIDEAGVHIDETDGNGLPVITADEAQVLGGLLRKL